MVHVHHFHIFSLGLTCSGSEGSHSVHIKEHAHPSSHNSTIHFSESENLFVWSPRNSLEKNMFVPAVAKGCLLEGKVAPVTSTAPGWD